MFSDGDIEVFIELEEAGVINGRIIGEHGGIPPLQDGGVAAWWVLDDDVVGAVNVDVAADGVFSFGNLFGDRISRSSAWPQGWHTCRRRRRHR